MKKKLIHNLGLKIWAVLIAICLWLVAININDPVSQRIYTVPVQILNINTLTNAGKYVEVLEDTDTVRVTVRASRSVLSDFSEKNLIVTADVSEMTEDNRLPIKVSSSKEYSKIESMEIDKQFVDISVENTMKTQKRITVEVLGNPAEGYILGNTSTDQNAVIITGPESIVSEIASAQVEINVEGVASDVDITLPVHLYDADGREVDDAKLTKSVNQVFTTATILQKKEVPIEYTVNGKPAEGYIFTGNLIRSPEQVTIAAKPSVLKNVNAIVIEDAIDLSGEQADVAVDIELKPYLPDNTILADTEITGTVSVTAQIEKEAIRILEISTENITLTNVPEGYRARLRGLEDTVTVRLKGLASELEQVDESSLVGVVDVSAQLLQNEGDSLTEGSYYPKATFTLPEYVSLQEEVTIHIVLSEE